MRLVFFVHSAVSDWNHGNAHFLRGLMSALARRGHEVLSYEARRSWSVEHLLAEQGPAPIVRFARAYPEVEVRSYDLEAPDLTEEVEAATATADAVLVHEWNAPALVAAVGEVRRRGDAFPLLFHDSHHRAWSDPRAISAFDLGAFDGVLAFGHALREIYLKSFGVRRAWTFHEAADIVRFRPLSREKEQDVVWIGNWGDGERADELERYWLDSARALAELRFAAYGVRYPVDALRALAETGVEFRGWAASLDVPEIFARSRVTLHVPRRAYADALPGIPTIRVFEALACGIPLVCSPWQGAEGLFRAGDFRMAATPAEMVQALRELAADPELAAAQAERGLQTVRARHTCGHRADLLLEILDEIGREGAAGGARVGGSAAGAARNPTSPLTRSRTPAREATCV